MLGSSPEQEIKSLTGRDQEDTRLHGRSGLQGTSYFTRFPQI